MHGRIYRREENRARRVVSLLPRRPRAHPWGRARLGGRRLFALGAGEIVLNSIDSDGMQTGYDLEITRLISESVPVPVVASGGAWELGHFTAVLDKGKADAVLAASVFHYGKYTIGEVKAYLAAHHVPVRL